MGRTPHKSRSAPRTLLRSAAILLVGLLALGDATLAGAVTRDVMIQRAKRWVDLKVPYSQSKYFEGYRQDCSGFVSMSWWLTNSSGTPFSLATNTLPGQGVPIAKDRLLPGDMIVRPKTATSSGHAVIFGGWVDASRTNYWCYEQSNSAGGARLRQTQYPYWNPSAGFSPYRYKHVTEDLSRTVRVAGTDRYSTAAAASAATFKDASKVSTVVLATGESWPDALGAAGLAGAVRGPVLLTGSIGLAAPAKQEIVRLAPQKVLVVGGAGAVSDDVVEQVRALGVSVVDRIGGIDRYETAALVAQRAVEEMQAGGGTFDKTAYVVTGEEYADALSVAPVSAARVRPVVLVGPSAVPEVTQATLASLGVTRIIIIGGEGAVSRSARDQLAVSGRTVTRIAGVDRYSTSRAVADHGVAEGLSRAGAGFATGTSFPDALAAGPALGMSSPAAVLYLTSPVGVDPALYSVLKTNAAAFGTPRVYGGSAVLSNQVRAEMTAALRGW